MKPDLLDLTLPFVHQVLFGFLAWHVGRGHWLALPFALYCGACALGGAFQVGRFDGRSEVEEERRAR